VADATLDPSDIQIPTASRSGVVPIDWSIFVAGIRRYPQSILVALIAAWTLLATALWAALLVGILGAIVGAAGGANASTSFGSTQAGGMVGALGGAIAGAGIGFIWVYGQSIAAAGPRILISLVIGAIFGLVITIVLVWIEQWLMYLRGYRPASKREALILTPILTIVGERMGLTKMPEVLISDKGSVGAWAHTRHIVLAKRMLDLSSEELSGVIAHELHHWRSGDTVGLLLVTMCAWPLALSANLILWIRRGAGKFGGFLTFCMLWPFTVMSRFLIQPVLAHESRKYEYQADSAAFEAGYGRGLIQAFEGMRIFEPARTGWDTVVNATHPPTEYRIEALEDDLQAPHQPTEPKPRPQRRS